MASKFDSFNEKHDKDQKVKYQLVHDVIMLEISRD